jgi:N6-adenosine-specific RNA methylase IME4
MEPAHLYLWVPNALLPEGLEVLRAWGFEYKTNLVWHKVRADGGSDGRCMGFYYRNVTETLLFGVRGRNARTLEPGLPTRAQQEAGRVLPNHRSL